MTHWNDSEEWRPIPGWEGLYEVSNWGRVRSLKFKNGPIRRRPGKVLVAAVRAINGVVYARKHV